MSTMDEKTPTGEAPKGSPKKVKGNASWRPVTEDLLGKAKGFGYRKVRFDNVPKRLAEGWQLVAADNGEHKAVDGGNRVFGGKRVDDLCGGVGFIYMRLPDEGIQQRNEYFNDRTEKQIRSIVPHAQKSAGDAVVHGKVDMDRRGHDVKQVIE